MSADDPDAMWKPGFIGDIRYAAPVVDSGAPSSVVTGPARRRHRRRWIATTVAIAGAAVAITVVHHEPTGESSIVDGFPAQLRQQWATTLDVNSLMAMTGTRDTVVVAVDWQTELVALDAATGRQRWRTTELAGAVTSLDVVAGTVVAVHDDAGARMVSGFDVTDGALRWSRVIGRSFADAVVDGTSILTIDHRGDHDPTATVSVLDPRTGVTVASVDGDVTLGADAVERRDGGAIELYDRHSLDLVAQVDTSVLDGLAGPVALASTDAGVVVATASAAWLLDRSGAPSARVDLPGTSDDHDGIVVSGFDGSGRYVLVQGGRTVTMLTARDGPLRELWTRPALLTASLIDGRHDVVGLIPLPPGKASDDLRLAPRSTIEVVGAADGDTRWTGALSYSLGRREALVLSADGFIAGPAPSDARRSDPGVGLEARRFSGERLWTLTPSESSSAWLVPGAVMTYVVDGADATVTITRLG